MRLFALAVLVGSSLACSEAEVKESPWIDLARLPVEVRAFEQREAEVLLGDARFELTSDAEGDWLVRRFGEDELRQRTPIRYSAKTVLNPVGSGALPDTPAPIRLRAGDRVAKCEPTRLTAGASDESFVFVLHGPWVSFTLPVDIKPTDVQLEYSLAHGVLAGGVQRVRGQRFSGSGFAVRSGMRADVALDIPAQSELRFATTAESVLRDPDEGSVAQFRVLLDGVEIHASDLSFGGAGAYAWHEIVLPIAGCPNATLSFEVTGDLSHTAFLAPRIAPMQTESAPPADSARADVAIFLADTFRADNLTALGQELDLTPNIDAFSATSRSFLSARSVSTHTLSGHASLFTGLYPLQNGIWDVWTALPSTARTLAEAFASAGYRTIAITDRGMVTSDFGMAQGFEFFDSHRLDMESTLARTRAALAAHDARPLFLFVHTYRAHAPFVVSLETRERLGDALHLEGEYDDWTEPLDRSIEQLDTPEGRRAVDAMRQLYLGAVADLDRGFGDFLTQVRDFGLLERGYLVFTSDHGEAFGEHNLVYHTGPVFEPLVRIPLILAGRDILPGTETAQVSLVDVAPTLLDLADLPSDDGMVGRSLMGDLPPVPIFLYQCSKAERARATVGLVDGSRKIIMSYDMLERREIGYAFDLSVDPHELTDVSGAGATWPAEVLQRFGPRAEALMEQRNKSVAASLGASGLEELKALGYLGE